MRRLFSLALFAYPRAFRRRFGDEMYDDFRRRPLGTAGTVRTLGTLAINGLAERWSAVVRWAWFSNATPHLYEPTGRHHMFLDTLRADVRHTIRLAVKTPVFTTLTILTLALGIGATSAIFAVINGVLLRALPYRDDARLVNVWSNNTSESRPRNPLSPANFLDFQRMNTTLDGLEGYFAIVTPTQLKTDSGTEVAFRAVRHVESVQHAWPLRRARPRVRCRRTSAGRGVERRVLAAALWRRSWHCRQAADALRDALPGDRRDAAGLRVPVSRHARAERVHARHQHRHVAADHLLRPGGRLEPDADVERGGRSLRSLVGRDRPRQAWSAVAASGRRPEANRRAARAGVPVHEQGLEHNRRALDRSIRRGDPSGVDDPARRHRVRADHGVGERCESAAGPQRRP